MTQTTISLTGSGAAVVIDGDNSSILVPREETDSAKMSTAAATMLTLFLMGAGEDADPRLIAAWSIVGEVYDEVGDISYEQSGVAVTNTTNHIILSEEKAA